MPEEIQVIPKTYDRILWLIRRLKEFFRDQRFQSALQPKTRRFKKRFTFEEPDVSVFEPSAIG